MKCRHTLARSLSHLAIVLERFLVRRLRTRHPDTAEKQEGEHEREAHAAAASANSHRDLRALFFVGCGGKHKRYSDLFL